MRIFYSIKKEMLEVAHDRTMLLVLVFFPIFIMLFMGSSFGSIEISGLPVGVVGPVNTTFSSVLFSDLNHSSAFNLKSYAAEEDALEEFRNGRLRAVIIVPEGFEDALLTGSGAEVRIIVDNSDIALQEAILAAMSSVIQASSTNITKTYVSSAWEDLYQLNQSASSLAGDIEKSRGDMESTRDKITALRQNMSLVDVERLEASLESSMLEIKKLQRAVDEQNESGFVDDSEAFLHNASFALNESINVVGETHAKLLSQVDDLNDTRLALDTSILALETIRDSSGDPLLIAALNANILGLESLQNNTAQQIADAEAQITELEELDDTLQAFAITLEKYTGNVSEAKEKQGALLEDVSRGIASINDSFRTAREDVGTLRVLLSEIEETTDDIGETFDDVLTQTGEVTSLITSLEDTVAVQTSKDPSTIASPLSITIQNQYARSSFVDFIIPQVIAVSLLFSCFLLASISLVREKTRRTIIRLLMVPNSLAHAVAAKILSITLISVGQVAIILLVAVSVFAVEIPNDLVMLLMGTGVSALVLSSIGMLIGFYARSESAAIQTSLLIAIPMLFLGNIIFSPDLLPMYTQILQQLLPLAHITNIFKVVLITNGDPTGDMVTLMSYFVFLALIMGLIVYRRRDITHYV